MKRYIRDYKEVPFDVDMGGWRIKGVMRYGTLLYDPEALFHPHCIPAEQIADPNDKTLHVEEVPG